MRKCAQCGKDIPSGNTSCNYCGYNPNDINKHYSFGKTPNMNKIPINANKGGKLIITIILISIFAPFIMGVVIMLIFGLLFVFGVFEEDNSMSCNTYCSGEYVYVGEQCYCSDGNLIDENGRIDSDFSDVDIDGLNSNIHLFETNTLNLERYVNNNEDVVVVVYSDSCVGCSEYVVRILDMAMNDDFNLFIYKSELLSQDAINKLFSHYYLAPYDDYKPLTFVISNGKATNGTLINMTRSEIEDFLSRNGII